MKYAWMKERIFLAINASLVFGLLAGCSAESMNKGSSAVPLDLTEVFNEYYNWTPVLKGDVAFTSAGHGGVLVRSYLGPKTKAHLDSSSNPYPLPEGALLTKAVVQDANAPGAEAGTLYIMRKETPGFDPENGDWSYYLAKRKDGKLELDPAVGVREKVCVSCHIKFKQFDNVQTVDFFLNQRVGG